MKFRRLAAWLLSLVLAVSVCGCAKRDEAEQDKIISVKSDYTPAQMYILMGSMHEAVAGSYTEDVFTAVVDGAGATYDDKFLEIMHDYMVKLSLMRAMADERGLKLTSDEEKSVGRLADAYMEELTAAGIADIARADAVKILTDQLLMPRLREDIMGSYNVEISESEARVMDISMLVTDSSDKANEAMTQISDGQDFITVAQGCTVQDEIELKVCREDLPQTIADTVFEMEDGAVSPVMQSGGRYYIIRCDSGYDIEATAQRKDQLGRERRRASVGTAYQEFCTNHECIIDDETWTAAVALYKAAPAVPDIFEHMDGN